MVPFDLPYCHAKPICCVDSAAANYYDRGDNVTLARALKLNVHERLLRVWNAGQTQYIMAGSCGFQYMLAIAWWDLMAAI